MAKKIPAINASSMADISFLLLIFFLVTTSMDVNQGLARRLPAPIPPVIAMIVALSLVMMCSRFSFLVSFNHIVNTIATQHYVRISSRHFPKLDVHFVGRQVNVVIINHYGEVDGFFILALRQ